MPRLLALGHVTRDRLRGEELLGGSVTYAALAARALGWEAAVATAAGTDFDPARELPGVRAFVAASSVTTRFQNDYDEQGERHQTVTARAEPIDVSVVPDDWRRPEVLLLGPVAGELPAGVARGFEAEVVGAIAQGWVRAVDEDGAVEAMEWQKPQQDLLGVHVLFLSERDLPRAERHVRTFLEVVPVVALTRGWEGLTLFTREGQHHVPSLPREEVDPTGAGDVFAAAFLVRYQETGDLLEAAGFGACAASCAVEGPGASALGDRAEVERRLALRERLIEEGEWDE